jgi:protein JSN1
MMMVKLVINFEHLDDAVRARKALSGREILGSEVGAVKIGYAKVPVKAPGTFSPSAQMDGLTQDQQMAQQQLAYETLARIKGASAVPLDQQILSGSIQDYRSNLAMSFIPNGIHALNGFPLGGSIPNTSAAFPLATSAMVPNESSTSIDREAASSTICTTPLPSVTEMQLLMKELCRDPNNKSDEAVDKEYEEDKLSVAEFRPPVTYYTTVPPPINQLDPHRRLVSAVSDPARLREIRKRFDSNTLSQEEMDQIASELLEEIIYLSSDYIGNTIVQKLFEKCSHPIKMMMLERCAPHLAIIGCHKNGTWAAQKMIDCASTAEEMKLISQNLRPFGPPLLLDSLGNYVMQCCLRFGSPYNDFVFDSIVDRIWEVAQGRFGARSVRTCLESKHALPLQIKRVAIAVILNSIPLATNPNGTLLLTWLLDSSGLAGRYRLLAPRLAPHLAHLCTHKLASVTVLRIINQNFDPIASRIIVDGIFHSNKSVLEEILGDQAHGVNLISKTLTSSFLPNDLKADISEKTKEMIVSLRVQHIPGMFSFSFFSH